MSEGLDIQITGHESFNWGEKKCSLVKGQLPSETITFECIWETKGLTNNSHTQLITIQLDKWEEAKRVYDQFLEDQNEDKVCATDSH